MITHLTPSLCDDYSTIVLKLQVFFKIFLRFMQFGRLFPAKLINFY